MKVFTRDGEFELTPEMVRGLQATFPAINVGRELQRIYWWSYKNASRRWQNPVLGIEAWMRRAMKATLEARQKNSRAKAEDAKRQYLSGVRPREIVKDAWWCSNEGVERKAHELGLQARAGEGWQQFKARVQLAAKEREAA